MGDEPAVVGHMIYDVARQFAPTLGIHLQDWEDGIIETDKSERLRSVGERAMQLLGESEEGRLFDAMILVVPQ